MMAHSIKSSIVSAVLLGVALTTLVGCDAGEGSGKITPLSGQGKPSADGVKPTSPTVPGAPGTSK